jgi:excisionase family DNA binding protein
MKVNLEGSEEFARKVADHVIRIMEEKKTSEKDEILNVEQVAELIGYRKTSIYGLVKKNKIPFHKKGKLFFLKSEIIKWLKSGKTAFNNDIKSKADQYLLQNSIY